MFVCVWQVWSITYHSWMTFVYLLAACIIWMIPSKRRFCLSVSPLIVCYTEALLTINYIYGFNLDDDELPASTDGGYKLEEIGLVKYDYPCVHLAVQIAFSLAFWLTLRQHMREVHLKKQAKYMDGLDLVAVSPGESTRASLTRPDASIGASLTRPRRHPVVVQPTFDSQGTSQIREYTLLHRDPPARPRNCHMHTYVSRVLDVIRDGVWQ